MFKPKGASDIEAPFGVYPLHKRGRFSRAARRDRPDIALQPLRS